MSGPVPSQSTIQTVLRGFLLQYLPAGVEVVASQDNRVPEPAGDFVTMTVIRRGRLATNVDTYQDGAFETVMQPTEVVIQLDVHSASDAAASDMAQTIATLVRDERATTFFTSDGIDAAPFYADDPKQVPFLNGEQQYETRYVVDVHIQANQALSGLPQQFADELVIDVVNVEATFPV